MRAKILIAGFIILCLFLYVRVARARGAPQTDRLDAVKRRLGPILLHEVKKQGFKTGAWMHVRIFKESNEMEVWLRDEIGGRFRLFSTYHIATHGGKGLGPKLKEGDGKAPEGFYQFGMRQLNPKSKYHLAFNIGYPNGYDLALKRTGSAIMVHGSDVSIGCFAMTDPQIEIIYLLAEQALRSGQGEISVHIFPFRMTAARLKDTEGNEWHGFWQNLKEGCELFEKDRVPPLVGQRDGKYFFKRQAL